MAKLGSGGRRRWNAGRTPVRGSPRKVRLRLTDQATNQLIADVPAEGLRRARDFPYAACHAEALAEAGRRRRSPAGRRRRVRTQFPTIEVQHNAGSSKIQTAKMG